MRLLASFLSAALFVGAAAFAKTEPIPCGVIGGLVDLAVGGRQVLGPVVSRKGASFELRVQRLLGAFRFQVYSTGEKPEPVGFALVTEKPAAKQLFLNEVRIDEDLQQHGLAGSILSYLYDQVAPGTTLRLMSTNIETNATLDEIAKRLFPAGKAPGNNAVERTANRNRALTTEVRRLLREGPREKIPVWAKALDNAGWKDVEVEVAAGGNVYLQARR